MGVWVARIGGYERVPAFTTLQTFRQALYDCFERRADALMELTDALLTAGPVLSPAHLSLEAVHRRGWGSLYAALAAGRVNTTALRDLLAQLGPWPTGRAASTRSIVASGPVRVRAQPDAPSWGYYHQVPRATPAGCSGCGGRVARDLWSRSANSVSGATAGPHLLDVGDAGLLGREVQPRSLRKAATRFDLDLKSSFELPVTMNSSADVPVDLGGSFRLRECRLWHPSVQSSARSGRCR